MWSVRLVCYFPCVCVIVLLDGQNPWSVFFPGFIFWLREAASVRVAKLATSLTCEHFLFFAGTLLLFGKRGSKGSVFHTRLSPGHISLSNCCTPKVFFRNDGCYFSMCCALSVRNDFELSPPGHLNTLNKYINTTQR